MNVAALLGPAATERDVRKFNVSDKGNLAVTTNFTDMLDAALIFGGDGTVHRYLPQLRQTRIPALVVSKGSGNDFAKASASAMKRML